MDLAFLVQVISIVSGISGLVTGSISLAITLREKRRNVKVALKWGIDATYEKTSGIVLWIYAEVAGYQPVVLQNAGLHVKGVRGSLLATKPLHQNHFPLKLESGDHFQTSISSEVLIDAFRALPTKGTITARGYVGTVFGEFQSAKITPDLKKLEDLIALVQNNANYTKYKSFQQTIGMLNMNSFTELEEYLHNIVQNGFEIKNVL